MKTPLVPIIVACLSVLKISVLEAQIPQGYSFDSHLVTWVKSNISPATQLPYSFFIPEQHKSNIYQQMNQAGQVNGAIERSITASGLDIYDGAVYQIILSMLGGEDDLKQAQIPFHYYWNGSIGNLDSVRSGYPINLFIYDAKNPQIVSSNNKLLGQRGFIFRIINADGDFLLTDPMDGQKNVSGFPEYDRLHWVDWKPVAGENAWVVIAAMQMYHHQHFDKGLKRYRLESSSVELRLSEELARAAIVLQSEIGGIRMAPIGTHRNLTDEEKKYFTDTNWWYSHISTENNISWYAAFRMLYEVTGKKEYQKAMQAIERYLTFVWDKEHHMFHQGAYQIKGKWIASRENFALDVQTWAIACLGPATIDAWLGEGSSYQIWQNAKKHSGVFDEQGNVLGVGYTDEHDRVSVEWSAGAMVALQEIGAYYMSANSSWAQEMFKDKLSIRQHMQTLHYKISEDKSAYSYSSKRGWIPFGWNSHAPEVLSMASTGWMMFVDAGVNPFRFIQ